MAKNQSAGDAPTMIIPSGTEIRVDVHGQLSIRTPGNLVIQNSGNYGKIESVQGSIRIESNAEVEAVEVTCADICYIQGRLTAWKVEAQAIQLDSDARASIVLQETERLEIGREARLVGNFSSEKELFLLFSRFAENFRSLPLFSDRDRAPAELPEAAEELVAEVAEAEAEEIDEPDGEHESAAASLPEPLFFALVLLEREKDRSGYGSTSRRVMEEVVKLLRADDREALRLTYRTLFDRVREPGPDVKRARRLVEGHFEAAGAEVAAEARGDE